LPFAGAPREPIANRSALSSVVKSADGTGLFDSPFRPFSARAVSSAIADHGNACIRWPDRRGPVQRTSGPFPDVPVLATAGDLDPNVPTREARRAARQFATADVVEVPNAGHVPEG